jgi:hypothetical protein
MEQGQGSLQDKVEPTIITMNDVPALSVKLSEGIVMWKLDSGSIELNAFTGKVAARLDSSLSEFDRSMVISGLNSGSIMVADEVKDEPPRVKDTTNLLSLVNINSRILLDETKTSEFAEKIQHIRNAKLLSTCLDMEREEKNRKAFIKVLDSRLKELE